MVAQGDHDVEGDSGLKEIASHRRILAREMLLGSEMLTKGKKEVFTL